MISGDKTDIAFYGLAEIINKEEEAFVENAFVEEKILRNWVDMGDYEAYKFVVQIDGHANSWGLIKKLRLGSCLLVIESEWNVIHDQQLIPWTHYVPVKADLRDFNEKALWCLDHQEDAQAIAARGRQFALGIDYNKELGNCANAIHSHFISKAPFSRAAKAGFFAKSVPRQT